MTADQLPGMGASPEDADSKVSISPEMKARFDAARAQMGRIDKILADLKAKGIDANDITVKKKGTEDFFSIFRNSVASDDPESNREFLSITNPPVADDAYDEAYNVSITLEMASSPRFNNNMEAYYKGEDGETTEVFDSAIQKIASLLDQLGFPPVDESIPGQDNSHRETSTMKTGFSGNIPTDMNDLRS